MRINLLILLFLTVVHTMNGQCPTINAIDYSASPRETYCPGKVLPFSIFGTRWTSTSSVEIYGGGTSTFDPLSGQGVSLGQKNLSELTCNPSACPLVNTVYINGCGSEDNEMVVISSGGGVNYKEIVIDFDLFNNNPGFCNECGDIGRECSLTPLTSLPGCSTLKTAAADGYIPPNALVVIFTSAGANPSATSFATLCGFPMDVYAFRSTCNRGGIGAFTNKGEATGTRRTVVRLCVSCAQDFTYDTEDPRFMGVDGDALTVGADNSVTPLTLPCTQAIGVPDLRPFTIEATLPSTLCGLTTIHFKAVIRDQGCAQVYNITTPFTSFVCPTVSIRALPDSSICRGGITSLFTSPTQWNRYAWSTNRNSATLANIMPTTTTTYMVTVTDGQGCTASDQLTVQVNVPPVARITATPNDSVCAGETVTLRATSGAGFTYRWSTGATASSITTTLTAAMRYTVTITNNNCPATDSITLIPLSPEDCFSAGCPEVVIQPFGKTICRSGGPQQLLAALGTGPTDGSFSWSGPGIQPDGLFDPGAVSVGKHELTVTYTRDTCTWQIKDTVVVINPSAVLVTPPDYCVSSAVVPIQLAFNGVGPFTIYYTIDGQDGRSTVVNDLQVTLNLPKSGTPAFFRLDSVFDGTCQAMLLGHDEITLLHPITQQLRALTCEPDLLSYRVSIELSGDPLNRYVVDVPGSINGTTYTSDPIPIDSNVTLTIQSRCDTVQATFQPPQCVCTADAGTLRIAFDTTLYCTGALPATINLNVDIPAQISPGQAQLFIVHNGKEDSLGTVFFTSATASISTNGQDLRPGVYLAQAAVVTLDANNEPAWSLPCRDFSNPQYILVSSLPTAQLADSVLIVCGGRDSVEIPISIFGRPPVTLSFLQNSLPLNITTLRSGITSILLSATIPTLLQLTAIEDAYCSNQLSGNLEILFVETDTGYTEIPVCPGDTVSWRPLGYPAPAKLFHAAHRQDTFWIKTLDGCDSLLYATVKDIVPGVRRFERDYCIGGNPIFLEGRIYDEKKTTDTIISRFRSANGCDSIIYVNINVLSPSRDTIRPMLCLSDTVRYGDILFGFEYEVAAELRFSGQAANGCDSFLYVEVEFLPDGQGFVNFDICPRDTIRIGKDIFGTFKKSGTVVLENGAANGCDSTVIVNLRDRRLPIGPTQTFTICPQDSIRPFNSIYHAERRIGVDTLFGAAADGCDSLIPIQIQLKVEPEAILDPVLCPGEWVEVNGTRYDEANPIGLEVLSRGASNQCDSIVSIQLSFYPEVVDTLNIPLCQGASVTIGGVTFSQANPRGAATAGLKSTGCDSLVYVIIVNANLLEGSLAVKLCPGEDFEFEGQVFNAANPTNDVLLPGASIDGCDSLVHVSVTFYDTVRFLLQETHCAGDTILVNGRAYHAGNTQGTEIFPNASANGCDSIVVVNLTFVEPEVSELELHLCPGEQTILGDQTFDSTNTSGTVILPGQGEFGCDLIIQVTAVIDRITFATYDAILCPGQFVIINGQRYDEQTPSGIETLLSANQYGCDSIVNINLQFRPIAVSATSQVSGCNGQISKSVTINSAEFAMPPFQIAVTGKPVLTVAQLPYTFLVPDTSSQVSYVLTDASGCSARDTLVFDTLASNSVTLGPDQVIQLGESTTLEAFATFPIVSYTLLGADNTSCTNCLPLTIKPLRTIQYRLKAEDAAGCISEDDVTIIVEQLYRLYIPNIFSPNGDNVNDQLIISGDENLTMIHKFQVFDPWGELVFEAREFLPDGAQPAWDGRFHGELMKPGVFVYVIEASFIDGARRIWSGDVTLMR